MEEHVEVAAPAVPGANTAPAAAPSANPQDRAAEVRRIFEPGDPNAAPPNQRPAEPRNYIEARDYRGLPENYRAMKEDGSFDAEATLWNIEKHRLALEKRIGADGWALRPKTADEYVLDLPESLKPMADVIDPTQAKAFQAEAHEAGLSQKQYAWIMQKYLEVAPALVRGGRIVDAHESIAELKTQWPVQADFDANIGRANSAMRAYAGPDADGLFKDYGNDARMVRMLAKIGAEMGEDRSVSGAVTTSQGDVSSLQRSEAYSNPKHPDHERVSAQVRDHFQRMERSSHGRR